MSRTDTERDEQGESGASLFFAVWVDSTVVRALIHTLTHTHRPYTHTPNTHTPSKSWTHIAFEIWCIKFDRLFDQNTFFSFHFFKIRFVVALYYSTLFAV